MQIGLGLALSGVQRAIAAIWTPAANYPTGTEPGLWYDPSDLTRYTAADGPELIGNWVPYFAYGTGAPTVTTTGGQVAITKLAPADGVGASTSFATVIGKTYKAVFGYVGAVGAKDTRFRVGTSAGGDTVYAVSNPAVGITMALFQATTTTTYVTLADFGSASSFTWDSLSVRELTQISTATLFQDSGGTSPNTAVGQLNGLMLDKRLGLVLGPQLVTNGQFETDTGWIKGSGVTISGGKARIASTTTQTTLDQAGYSFAIGKTYEILFDISDYVAGSAVNIRIGNNSFNTSSVPITGNGQYSARVVCGNNSTQTFSLNSVNTATYSVDNISVKELPGNHLSQATAAARPLTNARVNLLTKTEDFADAAWSSNGTVVVTPNASIAPDDTNTADLLDHTGGFSGKIQSVATSLASYRAEISFKYLDGLTDLQFRAQGNAASEVVVNTQTASIVSSSGATNITVTPEDYGFYRLGFDFVTASAGSTVLVLYRKTAGQARNYIWGASLSPVGAATRYQRVNTATDYDTVGFPQSLTFDGLDDGGTTGTVVLGADMDCFIAVRRNSAANGLAIFSPASPGGRWAGVFAAGDGAPSFGIDCGTPVTTADGLGSNLATRDALHLALSVGAWHVLQFAGLNLASWTNFGIANYGGGFNLNADIAGVILCPAGDATTRQKNRQYLGNKVGLTLP